MGGLYHAILSGLLVQWLADPERAPTGPELAEGLRIMLRLGIASEPTA